MTTRKLFASLPGLLLAASVATLAVSGCSAASNALAQVQDVTGGCSALQTTTSSAQATVAAWVTTLGDLNAAATMVEGEWLAACQEVNADLKLDTTQTTASGACGVLKAYIAADLSGEAGAAVTLSLTVSPPSCQADLTVQGTCEASCTASAKCDVAASCMGGDVVVGCNGSCSGKCDVTAPSVMCTGTCEGSCTASAAVSCTGECSGSCTAPTWTGTCDAGCSASFSGTCGGNCTGTCNGSSMSGASCAGKCVGTCDAKASGSCSAMCTGQFSGGQCSGMCTGSCNVSAGAMCSGMCNGTCSSTPGSATCMGECHGTCSATTTPVTCNGQLTCMGSAQCHSDCQAQAQAKLNCSPPQVQFAVEGDDKLFASFQAHLADIGKAFSDTLELKDLLIGSGGIASQTESTFSAIGDIGTAGASCIAMQASVISSAQASISVSVSASATVSGG